MSSFAKLNKKKVCVNPFGRTKCSVNRRQVTDWMINKIFFLTLNDYICDTCRNQIRTYDNKTIAAVTSNSGEVSDKIDETDIDETFDRNDEPFFSTEAAIDSFNKFLNEFDVSPIKEEQLRQKSYCNSKMSDIVNVLKSTIFEKYETGTRNMDSDGEMLQQLKRKLAQSSDRNEKVKLLTLVPRSWSAAKISNEFPGKELLEFNSC